MPPRTRKRDASIPPVEPDRHFAAALIRWHTQHGRHDLPWQGSRDPYRVWLSEIMLQQTQVATVIGYYDRFLQRFPDVHRLAAATIDDVLPLWAGLGYYARARQAHRCAQTVADHHGGQFPRTAAELSLLPGIGPSTAAAIAAFCFDERAAILDGNVKRVLARHAAIQSPLEEPTTVQTLWALARARLPDAAQMPAYTQAIMDLGATLCRRTAPACQRCPVQDHCQAHRLGIAATLPARRPRKARPGRTACWLLMRHQDSVWLERRPPRGLWGGLLAPPSFADAQALATHLRDAGLAPLVATRWLPARSHAFTHFSLQFTVCLAEFSAAPTARCRPLGEPIDASAWEALALPAPVARLLSDLVTGKA